MAIHRRRLLVPVALLLASCTDMASVYTVADLNSEMNQLLPQLPVAELLPAAANGGPVTLVLRGQGSFFNPAPPADESWLRKKMTASDYERAIAAIDRAVSRAMVGLPRLYSRSDVPARAAIKARAAQAEVAALNSRWSGRGVLFKWQVVEEESHWRDTVLYIRIK